MNTTPHAPCANPPSELPPARRRDPFAMALAVMAAVLCGVLLLQIGRGGERAMADLVSNNADATLLAADAGNSEDVVLVLDQRSEALLLYRCANQRTVDFKGRTDLRQLFFEARKSGK
ncbi:MAG: hypothetical protein ACT4PL_09560 [Phycisphaerales bacterium]